MLKHLSALSRTGLTVVEVSPIPGLTHRQYKDARHWIKKHKRLLYGAPIGKTLAHVEFVRNLAEAISPRRHWWA